MLRSVFWLPKKDKFVHHSTGKGMEKENSIWTGNFIRITVANLLMALAFYFLLPVLPLFLSEKLSASEGDIGIVLAFYTIAALIIRPFTGFALDSIGRKSIYLLAFLLFSLLFAGYLSVLSILYMIFLRFLHGLTWGVLTTSGSTIAVDMIPVKRRGEGIGYFGLSMTIGMAIGPMIALFINGDGSYYFVFIAALALGIMGLLLALSLKFPPYNPVKKRLSVSGLFEQKALPVSLNMLLVMFTYGGLISFVSLYGRELGIGNSGPFFLILSTGIGVSRIFSGRAFDKSGPRTIVTIGLLLLTIGFTIISLLSNAVGFYLSALVLGTGFGIIMPTFQTIANNVVHAERRGVANSTFFSFFDIGIGLGMIGVGLLIQHFGYANTFMVCAGFIVAALLLFIAFTAKHYQNIAQRLG
ncbi:Multidrug resistance protein MdtG [anaerobic digester metagenome]